MFDALTYALGLAILPLVHLRPALADGDEGAPPAGLRAALAGWRLIARTGILRRTVTCTFAVHLLYGLALLCEPLYVRDVLGRSEGVFAVVERVWHLLVAGGPRRPPRRPPGLVPLGGAGLGVGDRHHLPARPGGGGGVRGGG